MTRSFFELGQSAWWLPVILLISATLSYFLYASKSVPWNRTQNWSLFGLRALAIFLILLLFLEPSIKKIENWTEKPIVVLAIDNSVSVKARGADTVSIKKKLSELELALIDQDIEVRKMNLSKDDSIKFNKNTTALSELFTDIDEIPSEDNLVSTILITDGIFNRGESPLYRSYLQPVFTVGMGDTIPPKDVSISRASFNKITYKGNQTPIRIEVRQEGFYEVETKILLQEGSKILDEKVLEFKSGVQEVEFLLSSEKEGLRHLVASLPTLPEESTIENNRIDIFLEVIDGRQKILITALAPHPDIKAIRASLEATDSYTTELFIPSIHEDFPNDIYDVIIYHGHSTKLDTKATSQPGVWHILSPSSAVEYLSDDINYLSIEKLSKNPDKVTGSFNQNFSKFKIEDPEVFESFPPIDVPFGNYQVSSNAEVLMFQKLGSTLTDKPLMVVDDSGDRKSAVLVGQNIWQWKFQEAAINNSSEQFDNFITKTIQFLSVKNDKKQFSFKNRVATYKSSQSILFDAEVYNDIYERIYDNEINITITDEAGNAISYDFVDSRYNTAFKAPSLPEGIYQYTASVRIGDELFTEQGEFLVENVNVEYQNLTANHRLLRNLSAKTNGSFLPFKDVDQLPKIIQDRDFKPVMKSNEGFNELIKSWWYFLLIFLLFSSEWTLRRYWGGY